MAGSDELVIALASREELTTFVEWAKAEDWSPGFDDAIAFFAADPGGFFVGRVAGEIVTMISAVSYRGDPAVGNYGFLGFYITRKDMRGKGYGLKIFNHAMSYLKSKGCASIGLDGVLERVKDYEKSAFVRSYDHQRFGFDIVSKQSNGSSGTHYVDGVAIVPLRHVPFSQLLEADRAWFGYDRTSFLSALVSGPGAVSFAAVRLSEDGKLRFNSYRDICGYVITRPAVSGFKIGPLFATKDSVASELVAAVVRTLPVGSHVAVDIPAPARLAWIQCLQASVAAVVAGQPVISPPQLEFSCARMYCGGVPRGMRSELVYGNTTLELG